MLPSLELQRRKASEMTGTVTPGEMLAVGALGGTVEVRLSTCLPGGAVLTSGPGQVIMMQPMVALKNALQEGRPIPTHPKHLYRGGWVNLIPKQQSSETSSGEP